MPSYLSSNPLRKKKSMLKVAFQIAGNPSVQFNMCHNSKLSVSKSTATTNFCEARLLLHNISSNFAQ